jgi:WD40 repeat protein
MRPTLGRLLPDALLAAALAYLVPSPAHAQYFGKNKVHYKNFKWQIIKTTHFEVYFYEGERLCALDAARMAERSYAKISRVLGYEMAQPIPVILYASHTDFQQTNVTTEILTEGTGGFTELLKRRVLLPFTGSYAELEHVLTHELVHAFQVEILYGTSGNLLSNPITVQPPLWFMEGMAEYLSVGRVDAHTEMWLRDAALQGYLIPIEVLSMTGDIRVYRFGQSIFAFIGQKFGDDKIGEILKSAARLGGVGSAVKSVLGMPLEELSEAWLEETRRHYLPQIVNYRKASEFAKRLTRQGYDLSQTNLAPCVSPDGTQVAYISDQSMYSDIYIADAGTGEARERVVKGERTGSFESLRFINTSLAWSADGKLLAFPAKIGGGDAIYLVRADKKKIIERIAFPLDGIQSPAFSPDGKRIAFVGLDGGRSDLFVCDIDGKNLDRLTDDRFTDRDPQWSPDGKTIAFTSDRGEETDFDRLVFGDYKITLFDLGTRAISTLPNQAGKNIAPQWSPDGSEIVFVSDRTGVSNVYSIEIASGDVYQLTNILTGVTGIVPQASPISLSRNGERLVFSAFDQGGWDVYSIDDPLALKGEPVREEIAPGAGTLAGEAGLAADSTAVAGGAWAAEADAAPGSPEVIDLAEFYPTEDRPATVEVPPIAGVGVLPDSSTFEVSKYKIRFTQDLLAGGAAFASNVGFAGQTAIAFSDILGNHNIYLAANIYGSIPDSEILLAYQNLKGRVNYGVSLFQFRNDYYIYAAQDTPNYETQIYRGVEVFLTRPFSKFSRLEFGVEAASISSKIYDTFVYPTGDAPPPAATDRLYYAQPTLALVHDNVLFGSTGPIQGSRSRLSVEQAFGDLQFTTGIVDLRKYVNIQHRYSIAMRLVAGASDGRDPQAFRIGGAYTFRGVDYGMLHGTRFGVSNLELRYPLIDRLKLGFPPLDFRGIRGVFFFDMGSAWNGRDFTFFEEAPNGKTRLADVLAAYGFGARLNVGYFIMRYDWAQLTDMHENLGWIDFFTLSADF